jgi:plastocyanin
MEVRRVGKGRRLGGIGGVCVATAAFVAAIGARPAPRAGTALTPTPATRAGGRIEGTVMISRALVARRPRFRIYADAGPGSQPKIVPQGDSIAELRNVVIYVDGAMPGAPPPPTAGAVIRQKDERFVPHVLPVVKGSTVAFPNDDNVFHNVFSLSRAAEFDLGRYPRGETKQPKPFTKTGTVQVFCHIHSDMSAIVLVLGNPFFTVPAATGTYTIDGVPPGAYTIVGWHERMQAVTRRVRVTEGQTTRLDFNIPLPAPPGSP